MPTAGLVVSGEKHKTGAGDMAQRLKAVEAVVEKPVQFPAPVLGSSQEPVTLPPGIQHHLLASMDTCTCLVTTYTHIHTHTHINIKINLKKKNTE